VLGPGPGRSLRPAIAQRFGFGDRAADLQRALEMRDELVHEGAILVHERVSLGLARQFEATRDAVAHRQPGNHRILDPQRLEILAIGPRFARARPRQSQPAMRCLPQAAAIVPVDLGDEGVVGAKQGGRRDEKIIPCRWIERSGVKPVDQDQ
jgi:hypothetical protein